MRKMTKKLVDSISIKECPRCKKEILLEDNQGECEFCHQTFRFIKKNKWEVFWWTRRWVPFHKEDF